MLYLQPPWTSSTVLNTLQISIRLVVLNTALRLQVKLRRCNGLTQQKQRLSFPPQSVCITCDKELKYWKEEKEHLSCDELHSP